MCGILGLVRLGDSDLPRSTIEYARDVMAHRGPDGVGLWVGSARAGAARVALAHRRLSILDLSPRGAQPFVLSDGEGRPARLGEDNSADYVLVYNGEIYNYIELREELRALGRRFRSDCDTEVVLAAYAHWGAECVSRFNGMFSFAIWDAARDLLFCARDRFGEKPFHYVLNESTGSFAFASEAKALIAMGEAEPVLDERSVYRYFRFREQAAATQTIWQGVQRLAAGHTLAVRLRDDRLVADTRAYWAIDEGRRTNLSEGDAAEQFADLFRESVRIRLRSDVPVGTSLSGGLDSSSVACVIHALGAASEQKAFTARVDDPTMDEGRFVDVVLAHTGIQGHSAMPDATLLIDEFDTLCFHQEEPFPTTSIFASYLVHRLAREHGVIVMLDGQGADEYLAGYDHYPALVLAGHASRGAWTSWWRERRALRARRGVDPVSPKAAVAWWLAARSRGAGSVAYAGDPRPVAFLNADVARTFADEQPTSNAVGSDPLRTRLIADLTQGHLQELLRYADRNSMAWSREVRLPFLDHRLVEMCLALPTSHLFRNGETKRVLRRAMRGTVPNEILDRKDKIGFQAPWTRWWSGQVGDVLRDRLAEAVSTVGHLVRADAIVPGSPDALNVMSLASSLEAMRRIAAPVEAR
jgi:asparagine synthase (glutamine-hydrolysing)